MPPSPTPTPNPKPPTPTLPPPAPTLCVFTMLDDLTGFSLAGYHTGFGMFIPLWSYKATSLRHFCERTRLCHCFMAPHVSMLQPCSSHPCHCSGLASRVFVSCFSLASYTLVSHCSSLPSYTLVSHRFSLASYTLVSHCSSLLSYTHVSHCFSLIFRSVVKAAVHICRSDVDTAICCLGPM